MTTWIDYSDSDWSENATLGEVREVLGNNIGKGTVCPACTRRVALTKLFPNKRIVEALDLLYQEIGIGPSFQLHDTLFRLANDAGWEKPPRSSSVASMRHLGLIARVYTATELSELDSHEHNVKRAWYVLTPELESWLNGQTSVHGVYMYDGQSRGATPETMTVHDAYQAQFNLTAIVDTLRVTN